MSSPLTMMSHGDWGTSGGRGGGGLFCQQTRAKSAYKFLQRAVASPNAPRNPSEKFGKGHP